MLPPFQPAGAAVSFATVLSRSQQGLEAALVRVEVY
jgi:hypothetical protein